MMAPYGVGATTPMGHSALGPPRTKTRPCRSARSRPGRPFLPATATPSCSKPTTLCGHGGPTPTAGLVLATQLIAPRPYRSAAARHGQVLPPDTPTPSRSKTLRFWLIASFLVGGRGQMVLLVLMTLLTAPLRHKSGLSRHGPVFRTHIFKELLSSPTVHSGGGGKMLPARLAWAIALTDLPQRKLAVLWCGQALPEATKMASASGLTARCGRGGTPDTAHSALVIQHPTNWCPHRSARLLHGRK